MPECDCGAHVSERFAAVFGDRANAVESCFSCGTRGAIRHGKAAGREVPDAVDRIECIPKKFRENHRVDAEVADD